MSDPMTTSESAPDPTAGERDEWATSHRGAPWGIGHPGPAAGCPYCTDTLSQSGYTTLADAYFAPHPDTPDADDAAGERCPATSPSEDWVRGVWPDHEHQCVTHDRDEHECACGAKWEIEAAAPGADDASEPR